MSSNRSVKNAIDFLTEALVADPRAVVKVNARTVLNLLTQEFPNEQDMSTSDAERKELENIATGAGYPIYVAGLDYDHSGDYAYKPAGAYEREAIDIVIEEIVNSKFRTIE